jgi:hypothetical protein
VPFVPGFAHDVFVSYAHGPKPLAGFRGMRSDFISKWTQSLVDDLSSQLDVFLGTKDQKRRVSIWMDPALDGTALQKHQFQNKRIGIVPGGDVGFLLGLALVSRRAQMVFRSRHQQRQNFCR